MEFFVYEVIETKELKLFREHPPGSSELRYVGIGRMDLESDRGEVPWVGRDKPSA